VAWATDAEVMATAPSAIARAMSLLTFFPLR
jgi:hypothetical protein